MARQIHHRNLELFQPMQEGGKAFIDIIDKTFVSHGIAAAETMGRPPPQRH